MATPPLLTLRGARVSFGGAPIFDALDVQLGRGERVCLVGRNGSGKSTLMKTLMGRIELDAGERFAQPGLSIAYLPQDTTYEPDMTVATYVALSGQPPHRVDAALGKLEIDGARKLGTLSGGEGRRAALARAFVEEPDILMLDEPTNHLDLATIEWLERTLVAFTGGLLLVSHDRAFLNRVTTATWWLERGRLRFSDQGFTGFDAWSEAVLKAEAKEAKRLDVVIAGETRWLLRGITARRRRNQGRIRKLEEMRSQRATFLGRGGKAKIRAEDGDIRSRLVIEARKIGKRFAGKGSGGEDEDLVIVGEFSTRVLRGDRIGIVGANGAGKTTLLSMLAGRLAPDTGSVRVAKHLKQAYFDQHRTILDPGKTLKRTLCEGGGDTVWVQGRSRHVVGYLKDFLFHPDQADSPVSSLSGGERNRLLLAKLLAAPSELLILDEPTNDLDMDTLDLLEDVLSDYAGTLLLVSHDREFLDRIVTSTIAMEGDGTAVEYPGGYSDYIAQRKGSGRRKAKSAAGATEAARDTPAGGKQRSARRRLGYKDQRDLDMLPDHIAGLEDEIAGLEASLADSEFYQRDPAGFDNTTARLAEARAELAAAEERWLELEDKRETLAGAAQVNGATADGG
jgi:ATP-binding cassette subfamily F protein uup